MSRETKLSNLRIAAEQLAIGLAFVVESDSESLTEVADSLREMAKRATELAPATIIDPEQGALTAINEALRALDYEPLVPLPSDAAIRDARHVLLVAREFYTEEELTDLPISDEERAHWISVHAAEQKADGRQ